MIIAVAVVGVMEVPIDDVIGVVAMRDGGVTAVRGMDVARGLFRGSVTRRAGGRIGGGDGDDVLVHMPAVTVVQVAVIQVVGVAVMRDGEVAAAGAVRMRVGAGMFGVRGTSTHDEGEWHDEEQDFFHG